MEENMKMEMMPVAGKIKVYVVIDLRTEAIVIAKPSYALAVFGDYKLARRFFDEWHDEEDKKHFNIVVSELK